jgi:peptidoglycan/xylan/chitin deacetylase (PgdA/CDA1 family)
MPGSITLSFDNGPEPEVTPEVLSVLGRRGLRATFFVLGHKLADPARRALAARARAEGHRIGNHTYSHRTPLGRLPSTAAIVEAEVVATERLVGDLAEPEPLFRPFGGAGALGPHLLSPAVRDHLIAERYTCVLWNAVPGDFRDPEGWPGTALAQCSAHDETLLVLHDLPNGAMRQLDRFLGHMLDLGFRFAQEFPAACVPIRGGRALLPLEPLVTEEALP